jgi:hypothetical protein
LPIGHAAIQHLPTILAEHPLPPRLAQILARLQSHFKYLDGQIAEIEKEPAAQPAHLHRCERFEQARDVAIGAVKVEPRSIAARVVTSAVLNDLGRSSEAPDCLNQAKLIDPAHSTMLY